MQKNNVSEEVKKPVSQARVPCNSTQLTTGQIQSLARLNKGQPTAIVVTSAGSGAKLSTLLTVPRAISGQPSATPAVCLANTRIISPQAINIIQRQIPASGVVGLSCVTAESLQQVLQGTPLTLVTAASPEGAAVLELQRKQSLLQQRRQPHQQTGATIHHLGPRGLANPISNQNVSLVATMSNIRQISGDPQPASSALSSSSTSNTMTLKDVKPPLSASVPLSTRGAPNPISGGPSPKKIKLEENSTSSNRIASMRRSVSNHKRCKMRAVKLKYRDHLTELFYLQAGGNMVEFLTWRKRPTQPLLSFLEGSKLDSDDEDDRLQEKRINDEVKVLTSSGSNIPVATPVAIATTLPPSVSALSQQAMHTSSVSTSLITSPSVTSSSSELQQHLTKSGDAKSTHVHKGSSSQSNQPIATKSIKSQSTSPGRSRQAIASVYETVTGSQDVIVERAKQEAQVIQRVNELRKEGLWSAKRLPRVQEPPRQKAHWDYLLEEMTWLAADFIQERKWKKATSRKIARMISNHFREKEMKEIKAEKEEAIKLKKIASQMAKMVKEFWNNIEKVVQYKQTTRLEEKKKKALDLHLSFIVDQTEKYSSWLTAGLQSDNNMSKASSLDSDGSDAGDVEFQPVGTASDDEETIEKEENEAGSDGDGTKEELEALKKESELPIEDLLKSLPQEMLDMPSSGLGFEDGSKESESAEKEKDCDFDIEGEDDCDEEETLDEQEKHEKDYTGELDDLKAEGELSVEELMKKYAGAYESDFEMPEESSEDDDDSSDEEESSGSEKETGESEEEEDEEEAMDDDKNSNEAASDVGKEAVGLEFLVKEEGTVSQPEQKDEKGPGKEFNDIAAAAQSLQPKGYTLETTEVKTKVPFLLKHTLREYQHVGLDWLATMHDKRLNGILADEMGLGKTIQTIALLAHLACEKGIWGPHLIVVPTSVMLNWEMEIKKWCPAFKILTYYGSIKERKLKRQGWTKTNAFHVCITSYKLVVQDHQAFRRKKWKYFILDEAQNIKNFKSQRWQMLLNFSSQRRLLLTGTPLQNSLMELWSLMHFLMPNVFQSHSEFKEWFSNPLTGMIEGSQEYNESLVRRLHKVLRPFLLRRLKNEVEKQMPQKFEHVVMCRLSKRQRFLYDDFMSQSKTKETLASGHFMSVINILMQLRKVCNHPNLFDPRPVISPFKMEGIVYRTASLVANALSYNPFKDVDIYSLYPSLADMETDLPAFVAERVKKLQAPKKLIEEIDSWPAPEPRPPPGQLKNLKLASSAALQPSESVSLGALNSKTSSSSTIKATVAPTVQSSQSPAMNNIKLLLPSSSSPSAQQSILIPNPNGSGPPIILPLPTSNTTSGASSVSSTSAAIAQAKLISSQLQSGLLHLVQTSSGHQVITVASTSTSSSTSSNPITTSMSSSVSSLLTSSSSSSSSSNVSVLKISSSSGSQEKPVMKVTPFVVSCTDSGSPTPSVSTKKSGCSDTTSVSKMSDSHLDKLPKKPVNRSELFLESLYRKKEERRRHILSHMARVNQQKCSASPVMGPDTRTHLQCFQHLSSNSTSPSNSSSSKAAKSQTEIAFRWCGGEGYVNCLFAQDRTINHNHPNVFWRESCHLVKAVRSPEDHIKELHNILHRFVFVTPPVISPNIKFHISHPNHSTDVKMEWCESHLKPYIHQHSANLHPIQLRTLVQFPEPRLIQYDCGKLQTMDILLRKLKSGQHRVLIFTQMTKMLDVLEAFLNFHGHRYLRLDGTTKVEQRQFLMDRFNADPRIFCFILSTRSGGIGVNLTGADTVIFYDSDWNPTMDAQAQDRCHRIGQTRDVHIYRLVSEMTVEENILKKANQKRLLGDLAIEGGNFTTAFFKQQTISDLFAEPSGLQSLMEAKEAEVDSRKTESMEMEEDPPTETQSKAEDERSSNKKIGNKKEETKKETAVLTQFEQALSKAEDETDAQAVKLVKAEQKAELAEFDENIPWDEREAELKKEEDEFSKVEMELAMLDKELTPIERYAVLVVEAQTESETAEELKMAEEDIENSKKDWELARLKALKEEEERKAELEEDEMLYIYSKDESQTFISDFGEEGMPMWCPPTPPQDDNDIYMDSSLLFLYEGHTMPEQSLPPIYVPKTHKKPKMETITTRKQKQRKEEMPRVPRSLFDKPKEVVNKQRKEAKIQRLRQNLQSSPVLMEITNTANFDDDDDDLQVPKMLAGRTPIAGSSQQTQPQQQAVIAKPEPDPTYPEWLVHEEWALLEAVQHIQKLNPDLIIDNPAQITNWDFVSDFVSVVGRIFRAPKHCRYQYENVVLPREDGRIMFNIKPKKSPKSIYKTKNTRPLRTEQLYSQEGLKNFSHLYKIRFEAMLEIGSKRPAPMRQTVNPSAKPTKHASVLGENGINYDSPLPPSQLAMRRAERIAMDKKKQQQAAAAQQQAQAASVNVASVDPVTAQRTVQAGIVASGVTPTIQGQQLSSIVSVTSNTVLAGQVPKVAVGPGLTAVSIARTIGATGNIIVNTPSGFQSSAFAALNKRMNQAAALPSTIAVSANLTPTIRGQRSTTVPSATAITMQEVGTIAVAGAASASTTTVTVTSQVARSALQTTVASPSLPAGTLTTQKLAAMATGASGTLQPQLVPHRSLTPQQINILRQNPLNIRGQSSPGTTQQLRAQKLLTADQIRAQQLKHPQKVITQQLLVPVRGGHSILQGKQAGLLRTTAIPHEQLQALRMRTQIQTQQGKQLQTAQIIQGQVTAVGQSTASTSQSQVALVKSVSASPSVTVPMTLPVTGISVGQQRTVVASRAATVSQIQQQQRMQLLHQQRKAGGQQKVTGLTAGKAGQIPLLIPQNTKLNSQILQQIGLVNKPIQQIIAHSSNQPTIITQVSQAGGQPITHMVAKVSLTTGGQQTLTAGGTPITVTQVNSSTAQGVGLTLAGAGQTAAKTAATITSLDSGGSSIQVHSVQPGQKTLGSLAQSLVTAQNVQVQQASSNTPTGTHVSQLLHVTPVSVGGTTTLSAAASSSSGQTTSITVPQTSQLVASALRGTTTTLLTSTASGGSNSTAPQISLVTSPVTALTSAATASTVQVQAISTVDVTGDGSSPAVVASSPSSSLSADAAGTKASPYTMRTRNAKH